MEVDHEIISTAILLLPLIKKGCQLKAKVCAHILVNPLVKLSQEKSVVKCTDDIDHPDMTIAVDWDVKHQTKPKKCTVCWDKIIFKERNTIFFLKSSDS